MFSPQYDETPFKMMGNNELINFKLLDAMDILAITQNTIDCR